MFEVLHIANQAGMWIQSKGTPRGMLCTAVARLALSVPNVPKTILQNEFAVLLPPLILLEVLRAIGETVAESGSDMVSAEQKITLQQTRTMYAPPRPDISHCLTTFPFIRGSVALHLFSSVQIP